MKLLPPENAEEASTSSSGRGPAESAASGMELGAAVTVLAVVPIRDVVLFPLMILPIAVGREKSIRALETAAQRQNRRLLLLTQKSPQVEDPGPGDLHETGTVGEVVQVFKLPDGSVKTFVQGLYRARAAHMHFHADGYLEAEVEPIVASPMPMANDVQALVRQARHAFSQYIQLNPRVPQEAASLAAQIEDPDRLTDVLAANISLKTAQKQELLEMTDALARLEKIYSLVLREIDILNLEKRIQTRVRSQIEKSQKEYFLNEQMKAIQKELKQKDDHTKELDALRAKAKKLALSAEAKEALDKEFGRLEKMTPFSPEAGVIRTYVDWILTLPWDQRSQDNLDLEHAQKILEEDHFGLEKAKERILEYLAVCRLKEKMRGPILCLAGPPGVGKTSLARSVARALGRQFVKMSLGGVRDEAEIRGHRRTYIGALPGRLMQQIRKAKSQNPVFLLDEIDKMGTDWRGDPAAALLEVLDPEQNQNFVDHYLDIGFDLSHVFFITTANTTYSIPPTLMDRMEVIRIPGYTLREKQEIAKRYLIPKQVKEHGLDAFIQLTFSDEVLAEVIEHYTQEAGVRDLDRQIATIARKLAKETAATLPAAAGAPPASQGTRTLNDPASLPGFLGSQKHKKEGVAANGVGVATGLAWTDHGGELLTIEVASIPGQGALTLTGRLGSTMQESAQTAFTYIRSISDRLGFELKTLKSRDFHLHVPEGAIPKDGPSAGIAMATALASFLTRRPVQSRLAMTGEVTLMGRVLAIGGLREKLIAAHREGIATVLIPQANVKDLEELPQEVKNGIKIVPVATMEEVLGKALT